jgi:serine/threonine protein kinase
MQVGDVVEGKYRLERLIGQGGMGAVWEVQHQFIGRRLALKVLLPQHVANETVVSRFIREAQAAAAIGSEHIVDVTDGGLLPDQSPYLIMEYLEGQDFGSLLKTTGHLEPGRAASLMLQVCDGVGAAHAKGIIHRDLKPENLFLTSKRNGKEWVKVLDFGIAKFRDQKLTMSGSMLGTLAYMSPEQVGGAEAVDLRSDLYALGVILYELLSGCVAIQGRTLHELVSKIMMSDYPSLESVCAELPPHMIWVVQRCMDHDPSRRFSSADELAGALRAFPFHADQRSSPPAVATPQDQTPRPAPARGRTIQPTVAVSQASRRTGVTTVVPPFPGAQGRTGEGDPLARPPVEPRTISPREPPQQTLSDHTPKFALIKQGRFVMGSPSTETGRWSAERPHEVILTRPYLMQSTPVTQAQWMAIMGSTPARFQGAEHPVESVSWFEAVVYCNLLSRHMGIKEAYVITETRGRPGDPGFAARVRWRGPSNTGFRLPTEAEWEFAARAATTDPRYGGLDEVAWHQGNSGGQTHPVGLKRANGWLLHDCLGNVFEWCWDWSGVYPPGPEQDPTGPPSGEARVFRGGCFKSGARGCRSAYRGRGAPAGRAMVLGFRLARSAE